MQTIFYPGHLNQPCQAQYGIAIRQDEGGARADIVVIDSRVGEIQHTPLIYTPDGLDLVLNKILSTDLQGIRTDRLRFVVVVDTGWSAGMTGYEYAINIDMEDYHRNDNPVTIREMQPTTLKGRLRYWFGFYVKTMTVFKRDVVAGSAIAKAGHDHVQNLTAAELGALVTAVGYQAASPTPRSRIAILMDQPIDFQQSENQKPAKYLH